MSTAVLLVLETLAPTERAVFVLREVFDVPYDEIAEAVEKSPDAVRQIAHRARAHVAARRPRVTVSRAERDAVLARFAAAASTGDLQGLMDVLAPDVVLLSDGGGQVKAALRPISGRDKVLRFLAGIGEGGADRVDTVVVNGAPALRLWLDGQVDTLVQLVVDRGLVTAVHAVRSPAKLGSLDREVPLAR